ncbi:hypothetical protein ACFQY4_40130 [Catellatospora bangladeshensis]|uniref:hypothetical protein n=1 Tax=Catellatospora bangladeshensis TaxID=310355 RepID=UPI0036097763
MTTEAVRPWWARVATALPKYGGRSARQRTAGRGTPNARATSQAGPDSTRHQPTRSSVRMTPLMLWCSGEHVTWCTAAVAPGISARATYEWCTSPPSTLTVAGPRTAAISAVSSSKECPTAAQCSRS